MDFEFAASHCEFFYLLLCCVKSISRACHILQKCESSNWLNILLADARCRPPSAVAAQCRKSNVDAVFAVAGRKSHASLQTPFRSEVFNNEAGGNPSRMGA